MGTLYLNSYFADLILKNAASTNDNMNLLITDLRGNNILRLYAPLSYNTDVCSKQYNWASTLYLLSILALKYWLSIKRLVEVSGHRKGYVDDLNTVDK